MITTDKITAFDISRLRIGEQIEYLGLVADIVQKYDPKVMGVVSASEAYKAACLDLESRFKKTRNSPITSQMEEKDRQRDNDIICLRMVADAMTRYFEPEINTAAKLLVAVIDQFGSSIYNMNYEEESAVIRNLINDLKSKQPLIDAVKKLNLKALVANLEKNNNEFRKLYKDRLEEKTYNQEISAGEALKVTLRAYYHLVRMIESKTFLEPVEALQKTIAEINTLTKRQIEKIQERENRRVRILDDSKEAPMGGL